MAIPDYEAMMLPLLKSFADQREHSIQESVEVIGVVFKLTSDELKQRLPSGKKTIVYDRVNWARTYLRKAGLIDFPRRGISVITARGLQVLGDNPETIDNALLSQFPEFVEFRRRTSADTPERPILNGTARCTPEELLQHAHQELLANLSQELLERIKACPPSFFEGLVIDLLVKMGYGGSAKDAAQAIGRSGDGGIDGIIKEDPLGLDAIYVQAKRWESTIGSPDIQKFVGALYGRQARKGVFITTSRFSDEARKFAHNVGITVVLIDGEELARLMINYGVGVSVAEVYEIKRIDSDYFTGEL